jgi:voltage-gated potassium channel
MAVLWRVSEHARGVLKTNQLAYVMMFTAAMVVAGGIIIHEIEPEIGTVADGVWWSMVTASTVGYGDISPRTGEGRVLAALLMLIGIGTIGMITGSIATYFIGARGSRNPHIQHVQRELDRWEEMTPEERRAVVRVLEALGDTPERPGS